MAGEIFGVLISDFMETDCGCGSGNEDLRGHWAVSESIGISCPGTPTISPRDGLCVVGMFVGSPDEKRPNGSIGTGGASSEALCGRNGGNCCCCCVGGGGVAYEGSDVLGHESCRLRGIENDGARFGARPLAGENSGINCNRLLLPLGPPQVSMKISGMICDGTPASRDLWSMLHSILRRSNRSDSCRVFSSSCLLRSSSDFA